MALSHIYTPRRGRRTTRLTIRGVDHAVHEWGEPGQPLIVFLHGFLDCGSTFQFVVDAFEKDWHVVAPDLRGFGDSHGSVSAYWFPDYLADLDALLEARHPDAAVRIVGHSMGANIAGLYAGAFPERVRAFVNLEGFGLPDSDPSDAPGRYRDWIEAGRQRQAFSSYPDFGSLAERIRRRNPRMAPDAAEFVARCWARQDDDAVRLRADPRHRLTNPVLYRRAEAEACWRAVSADVLLVAGGRSDFARGADPESGTASVGLPFRSATLELIEDAGHMLHFETPSELAAVIEPFLCQHL